MPEREINGGELWLREDEEVLEVLPLGSSERVGLVTRRRGLIYANVYRRGDSLGYKFNVPRWEPLQAHASICGSVDDARAVVSRFVTDAPDPR